MARRLTYIPIGLQKKVFWIRVAVLPNSEAPLLISKKVLGHLNADLLLTKQLLVSKEFQLRVHLTQNSKGYSTIPMMEFPEDFKVTPEVAKEVINLDEGEAITGVPVFQASETPKASTSQTATKETHSQNARPFPGRAMPVAMAPHPGEDPECSEGDDRAPCHKHQPRHPHVQDAKAEELAQDHRGGREEERHRKAQDRQEPVHSFANTSTSLRKGRARSFGRG